MAGQKARSAVFAPEVPAIHAFSLKPTKGRVMPDSTGLGSPVEKQEMARNFRQRQPFLASAQKLPSRGPMIGETIRPRTHALHAPVPRRAESPASGFGSRGAAREAHALRARVQGSVAVQQGEDPVFLRE